MSAETGTVLDRIVAARRTALAEAKKAVPPERLRRLVEEAAPPQSLVDAIVGRPGIALIAEMKRASASAGELRADLDPAETAEVYAAAGAAAVSVLTEFDFFRGTMADLRAAKAAAAPYGVAVLQKDFVFDEYQVWEARANGADAVLLIIAMLEPKQYEDLLEAASGLGMDALVEVFDEGELDVALTAGPRLVGINSRNLKTLETSLEVFERMAPRVPMDKIVVAESGMKNVDDVRRMGRAGARAVLVGETLMRAGTDAGTLVRHMAGAEGLTVSGRSRQRGGGDQA